MGQCNRRGTTSSVKIESAKRSFLAPYNYIVFTQRRLFTTRCSGNMEQYGQFSGVVDRRYSYYGRDLLINSLGKAPAEEGAYDDL